jgi:DNA-binding GntR family transcriptional regulator
LGIIDQISLTSQGGAAVAPRQNGGGIRTSGLSEDWAGSESGPTLPAHRTLAEKAFIALHQAILTGKLRPGERIPIEDLANALEMSPMPVREAIRRLDALGLVENVPHKGARITELSITDLREIYEGRLSLEPLAIALAAQRFTEEDTARAKAVLVKLRSEPVGSVELWRAHSELHLTLYRAARSAWLLRLIRPLWESSERYRLAMANAAASRNVRNHKLLVQACMRHDAEGAAHELTNHLVTTANSLAMQLTSGPLFTPAKEGQFVPLALQLSTV